jgi:hypothetical protein
MSEAILATDDTDCLVRKVLSAKRQPDESPARRNAAEQAENHVFRRSDFRAKNLKIFCSCYEKEHI